LKRLVLGVVVAGVLTATSSLPTSLTYAGNSRSVQQAYATQAPSPSDIVQTAKQYLGSPYAYIGNTPAGFSCIGFVNFVFHQNGVYVPFDSDMAWASAPHVDKSQLLPGDILFFSNTVFAGLSHVAIYIGNGEMIGADSFAVGVTTDQVNDPYWVSHYTGATRPLALLGTSPRPGTAATSSTPVATPTPTEAPIVAAAPGGSWLQPLSPSVNLYSGPGYEYTALTSLLQNGLLYVVQSQGGWYNVRTPGNLYGWVSAGQVKPIKLAQTSGESTPTNSLGLANASAVSGTPSSTIYVVVGPLLVRSGPSKSFNPVGFVLLGTSLTVYQLKPHWARISAPSGPVGWVSLDYVRTANGAPPTAASATPATTTTSASTSATVSATSARVTVPALNVRAQPDSHARVVSVLFSGEMVQVIGQRSGWSQVKLRNGTVGWASSQYLFTKGANTN
jgi:uncharacterized protein YgiM (DUF1202 family)